jgi:hypothetical protein
MTGRAAGLAEWRGSSGGATTAMAERGRSGGVGREGGWRCSGGSGVGRRCSGDGDDGRAAVVG